LVSRRRISKVRRESAGEAVGDKRRALSLQTGMRGFQGEMKDGDDIVPDDIV
jgi:hypothetical protein